MKRNKLLNSSSNAKILSSSRSASPIKHRHILLLTLLTIIGIFLTTIVLATGSPDPSDIHSQRIALPGQQDTPLNTTTLSNSIPLEKASTPTNGIETTATKATKNDLAIAEQSELEQIHLDSLNVTNAAKHSKTADTESIVTPPVLTAKQTQATISPEKYFWQQEKVKSGDNLSLIFSRVGLSAQDVYKVAQLGDDIKPLLNLKPGQTLRFGLTDETAGKTLKSLELKLSEIKMLKLTSTDTGFAAEMQTKQIDKQTKLVTGQINSSLFAAGNLAGLTDEVIMELAYIFGWDIDFALDIRQGDSFKVFYEEHYLDSKKIDDGDILAAEFTNRGNTFKAIRYTDASGNTAYYTPEGDSMRKTFNRTPVHFSRISSGFNPNRLHPVLKTARPHRGVDYAAKTGTPIMATGDGKVNFIGTKGGYGRTVILSHSGKYTTLYAHMSKFKSGLKNGQRVKQGQVIGYIGSSGLATGPHLHYEFRVNGVHRNPLTVPLPKAEPLNAKYMADFKQKSQPLLAALAKPAPPQLALNKQ